MIVVRFKLRCSPDKAEEVGALLAAVQSASQAVPGVITFDIGRDLLDADAFIATDVFDDRAALDRQEALQTTVPRGSTMHQSGATAIPVLGARVVLKRRLSRVRDRDREHLRAMPHVDMCRRAFGDTRALVVTRAIHRSVRINWCSRRRGRARLQGFRSPWRCCPPST